MVRGGLLAVFATAVSFVAPAAGPAQPDYDAAAASFFSSSLRQTVADMESAGLNIDRERFLDLFVRAFRGDSIGYNPAEAHDLLTSALAIKRPPAVAPMDAAAEEAWVRSQLSLPRTEELEGGVVLQRLVEGSGESPMADSVVRVMYTGRLSSGTEFDKTDEPFALPVNQVVTGLSNALQRMRAGGTYRVFIPPTAGYGEEAVMDLIPGNSALDFTIEILEIINGK